MEDREVTAREGRALESFALFTALDENRTRLEVRLQMQKPKPLFIARLMLKREFGNENPYIKWFERINELAGKQVQT